MTPISKSRKIAIPRLLHVGMDCLLDVAPLLPGHGFDTTRVLVGSGPGPSRMLAERVVTGLRAGGVDVQHTFGLEGRLDQAASTAATIIEDEITLAIAVGGGRAIDTVKLAASRTRTDFLSVPTTISNDGISSPVASLIGKDGKRHTYPARMPGGIVVDVRVVASAPARTVRAGIGDLASNLTAGLCWKLAERAGRDHYDAFAAMIAESAARPVLDLVEHQSTEAHEVLAKGLLLSGLAMAAAGTSRPCSGAEHLISHSLDAMLGTDAALHGEQVALGSLIAAAAHGSPLLDLYHRLFARLGLPRRPEDLGLTEEIVIEAVRRAPATRSDRYTVLSQFEGRDDEIERVVHRAFAPAPLPLGLVAS